jgi:hypothetical protein
VLCTCSGCDSGCAAVPGADAWCPVAAICPGTGHPQLSA